MDACHNRRGEQDVDDVAARRHRLASRVLDEPRRQLLPVVGDALRVLGRASALDLVVDPDGVVHVVRDLCRDADAMADVLSLACGDALTSELINPLPQPAAHTWPSQRQRCRMCEADVGEADVGEAAEQPGTELIEKAVTTARAAFDSELADRQWPTADELTGRAHDLLRLCIVDELVSEVLIDPEHVVCHLLPADTYATQLELRREVEPGARGLSDVLVREVWAEVLGALLEDLTDDPPTTAFLGPEVAAYVAEGVRARVPGSA